MEHVPFADSSSDVYSFTIEECILQSHGNHHVHCPVHNDIHLAQVAPDTVSWRNFHFANRIWLVFSADVFGPGREESDQRPEFETRNHVGAWSFRLCLPSHSHCQRKWRNCRSCHENVATCRSRDWGQIFHPSNLQGNCTCRVTYQANLLDTWQTIENLRRLQAVNGIETLYSTPAKLTALPDKSWPFCSIYVIQILCRWSAFVLNLW